MPAEDKPPEDVDLDAQDDEMVRFFEFEVEQRAWLRTIQPMILSYVGAPIHRNPKVQAAIDGMMIAAAERATSILNSDVPGEWRDS